MDVYSCTSLELVQEGKWPRPALSNSERLRIFRQRMAIEQSGTVDEVEARKSQNIEKDLLTRSAE